MKQPLIGSVLKPIREIPITAENLQILKVYCVMTRNFKGTSLRQMIKRTKHFNGVHLDAFVRAWSALKLIQDLEPVTRPLCYFILRNMWDIDFQVRYHKNVDFLSNSYRFSLKVKPFVRTDFKTQDMYDLYMILKDLDQEYWIPSTIFPSYAYRAEGKTWLSLMSVKLTEDRLDHFEGMVYNYIKSLKVNDLFVPPPDVCLRAGSSRYNDDGTIKRDFERPKHSVDCSFMLQVFNTNALVTREVWLPDKSTKINNSFWMIIGRQLLKADPTYPDEDPMVTWDRIKDKLKEQFLYFDLTGFGLQYPRELLKRVALVIARLYPSVYMGEQEAIFRRILDSVKVSLSSTKVIYPVRGIGLGYYEDLKTIGINAILYGLDRVSVYGDQGIISGSNSGNAIFRLKQADFYMKPGKHEYRRGAIRWSGWSMQPNVIKRSKLLFEPLISLFTSEYHWERKLILESYFKQGFHNFYYKWDTKLSFFYEYFFGFEVTKGDSLWHFSNGGVSCRMPRTTGLVKGWKFERLKSPKDYVEDNVVYETPFFTEWKRSDSKKFSIMRKNAYKFSNPVSSEVFEYINPIVSLKHTKVPQLPHIARCVSDSYETKLVVNHLMTTGKLTFGLSSNQLIKALITCAHARNPFEAYATGGYRILTPWRPKGVPSSEWVTLVTKILENVTYLSEYRVTFYDTYNSTNICKTLLSFNKKRDRVEEYDEEVVTYSPSELTPVTTEQVKKLKLNELNLSMIDSLSHRDDSLEEVTSLLSDFVNRQTNVIDVDTLEYVPEELLIDDLEYEEDV